MGAKLPPSYLRLRFATAAIATWLMNLGMFGQRFRVRSICSPGFNCHGCSWATAACPIGAIAYGSAVHALPVYAIGFVLAIGALLGRLVCGFACPMGLLQDLLHRIPSPKIHLPRWFRYGKYLALVLLVLLLPWVFGFVPSGYLTVGKPGVTKIASGDIDVSVVVSNLGTELVTAPRVTAIYRSTDGQRREVYRSEHAFPEVTIGPGQSDVPLPVFQVPNHLGEADLEVTSPQSEVTQSSPYQLYYCRLCPTAALTAVIPSFLRPDADVSLGDRLAAAGLRLGILGVFLVLMVIASRPLCRGFCPLGAIYALAAPLSLSGMRIDREACIDCAKCDKTCPMELDVRREVGSSECITCGDCMKGCPTHGISRTFRLNVIPFSPAPVKTAPQEVPLRSRR